MRSCSFGFVNHLLRTDQLIGPILSSAVPKSLRKRLIRRMPPFQYMRIGPVMFSRSTTEEWGVGVVCPLLPEHFAIESSEFVLRKIIASVSLAERRGAKIVGLGGLTSSFGDEGREVAGRVAIPVTSGNTFTSALVVKGMENAMDDFGMDASECTMAIIGATGDIGSACARYFADKVGTLILCARTEASLRKLASECPARNVEISTKVSHAVRRSQLIIAATSAITTVVDSKDLKPGTVLCDVGYPANVALDLLRQRTDVFAFEGGMASWDRADLLFRDGRMTKFSPYGVLHGCLAEVLLLTLAGKFESYSIGRGNIRTERMREIMSIASTFGFRVAPYSYNGTVFGPDEVERIRNRFIQGQLNGAAYAAA